MSLFTKDVYAGFLQQGQPIGTPSSPRPSAPAQPAAVKSPLVATKIHTSQPVLNRYQPLQSHDRPTAKSLEDFDPLSTANLARASDPWYDNNLVKSATSTLTDVDLHPKHGPVSDDNPKDDEWGEFVTFSPQQHENRKASPASAQQKPAKPQRSSTNRHDGDRHAKRSAASPSNEKHNNVIRTDGSSSTTAPHFSASSRPPYLARNSMPNLPTQRSTKSLGDLLLERIASSLRGDRPGRSSSFADLFSLTPTASASSETAPARTYDSYDVTFERGPIGLELETDWYGRQAVVKGFKKVNGGKDDGPAKLCGIIRVGDVLTAINGDSCLEMNFADTLGRLRDVGHERHVLHFKSLEAAGDLSVYSNDLDIVQAKKFIHQHKEKFYQPPPRTKKKKDEAKETQTRAERQLARQYHRLVLGCVERLRGPSVTAFNFHREDTGEFLLACSCVNEATGVFLFHTLQDSHLREFKDLPQSEDSAVYLGQMSPNFIGTEFTVLDHQQKRRNELGFIEYTSNVLGRVPNFLKCVFPRPGKSSEGDDGGDDGDDSDSDGEGDEQVDAGEEPPQETEDRSEDSQAKSQPREAPSIGAGMGDDSAQFNTHNTMMDRNGNISERYKRIKQSRSLSIVERLRAFSLNDLDTSLELATAGITSVSEEFESAWLDEDDHAGRLRVMRVKQARLSGTAKQLDTSTPYGAIERDDYQCDLLVFETKKPTWNETLGAWTLNFQGRVKMASKKNFMLVAEQGNEQMEHEFSEDGVYLRFGKVSKTRFSLDYAGPLSPILALAIAASSFAHKIAVT